MPHCRCIVLDCVFDTMKDCKPTFGSPKRCSMSLMISWNRILRLSGPRFRIPLGSTKMTCCCPPREQPQYEVGVKVPGFEKPHAAALAQVAHQVQLLPSKENGVALMERLQILDEHTLAFVQRRWADLGGFRLQTEQRLVEVLAEPDGLHALELQGFISPFWMAALSSSSFARISSCDFSIRMR